MIAQADGQAVEFQLDGVVDGRIQWQQIQLAAHAGVKRLGAGGGDVGFGADRQHRYGVHHRGKFSQRFAAHALSRRIIAAQLGMGGFQRLQLTKQPVVLGIGHAGCVQHVIFAAVLKKQRAQLGCARGEE